VQADRPITTASAASQGTRIVRSFLPRFAGLIRSRFLRSGPPVTDTGGYGGASPRKTTDMGSILPHHVDRGGFIRSSASGVRGDLPGGQLPDSAAAQGGGLPGRQQPHRRHRQLPVANSNPTESLARWVRRQFDGDDHMPSIRHAPPLIRRSSLPCGRLRNQIRHEAHIAEFFLASRANFRHCWP